MLMACSSWLRSVGMSPVLVVTSQFEQYLNIGSYADWEQ